MNERKQSGAFNWSDVFCLNRRAYNKFVVNASFGCGRDRPREKGS